MTMSTKPDPASLPCGLLDETAGLKYFPRMVGKIRLMEQGLLWDELQDNLGKGADGWLTEFLRLDYGALRERVLEGGSDEEILAWCEANGRPLNDSDRLVWNAFISKRRLERSHLGHPSKNARPRAVSPIAMTFARSPTTSMSMRDGASEFRDEASPGFHSPLSRPNVDTRALR